MNDSPHSAVVRGKAAVPATPYLAVRDLSKLFGSFAALQNIALEVGRGEFVCFLGPSGCGKTTLLRCIAGLDLPTTGTIRQNDRDITRAPPVARDFGIVFQSYALFPNLSVAENVGYGLRSKGLRGKAIADRVKQML
ncbi:MAG: ATP-binding cassette domain-containing protein, partial [Rhodospirillaceae bacterium]|nr:ATP-binding cassette domain-containing protein [Rhodospirillaceae bacterium]